MSERKIDEDDHWLVRSTTIRWLWAVSIAVLAATVFADFFVDHHGMFGIDGTFGFYAWYGFLSCLVLVVFAKFLGLFLKRPDDYYES